MKNIKKALSLLLSVLILTSAFVFAFPAEVKYYSNSLFKVVTPKELDTMYKKGDKFIVMLYDPDDSYSEDVGKNIINVWMNTYDKVIYGLIIPGNEENIVDDAAWVWENAADSQGYLWTPVEMFIDGGEIKSVIQDNIENKNDILMTTFKTFYGITDAEIEGISIKSYPDKERYGIGEEFDSTGLALNVHYSDGKIVPAYAGFDISGFDSSREHDIDVLVTYQGFTISIPVSVSETEKYSFNVNFHQSDARSMLSDVNNLRTAGGDYWDYVYNEKNEITGVQKVNSGSLSPLTYDYRLEQIAMQRAAEIAVDYNVDNHTHLRPDWSSYQTLYLEDLAEFKLTESYTVLENITYRSTDYSKADCFNSWLEEDEDIENQGHRRNMLSSAATKIGIACCEVEGYWFWAMSLSSTLPQNIESAVCVNETQPCDTAKKMTVEIKNTSVESSEETVIISGEGNKPGDKIELPSVTSVMTLNTEPGLTITAEPQLLWKSQDNDIASVDNGEISVIADGTATLIANLRDKKITCDIACGNTCEHELVTVEGYAATCTEDGKTDGAYCTKCDYVREGEVIPSPGHDEAILIGTPKTCTTDGLTDGKYCRVCFEELEEQKVIPASHSLIQLDGKEATCTEEGYAPFEKCNECDYTTYRVIEKKEHTPGEEKKENIQQGKCTEAGTYESVYYCTVCGGEISREVKVLPAKEHTFGAYSYDNNRAFGVNGTETATCTVCGEKDTREKSGTAVASVSIKGYKAQREEEYKTTITFLPLVTAEDGSVLPVSEYKNASWAVTGASFEKNADGSITVKKATGDYSVSFSCFGQKSESESVAIKHGFFDKIKAFFRGIFGKLTVVTQG